MRTLFSVNGGRTLQPFTTPVDRQVDPLQFYVAVRRFNYWTEGFYITSERRQPAFAKAHELLRLALSTIKAGTRTADVAQLIAAGMRPYRCHPVTERAFASRIGLALEEPPHTKIGATFEPWEFCSIRVGVTDDAQNHAIVSAVIRVRDDGTDVFWSA